MRIPAPPMMLLVALVALTILAFLAVSMRFSHSQDKPPDERHGRCHCLKWKHGRCVEMLCRFDDEGDETDDLVCR